jgi:AraC-like DNA-binding protein
MRHAAQRLQAPGMLAKQVAAEMGFSDPFQFSRTIRRIIGVSPRQFMHMQRPLPAPG